MLFRTFPFLLNVFCCDVICGNLCGFKMTITHSVTRGVVVTDSQAILGILKWLYLAGHCVPGHWVPGHWAPDQWVLGHLVPGHCVPGHWVPDQWVPDHWVPDQWATSVDSSHLQLCWNLKQWIYWFLEHISKNNHAGYRRHCDDYKLVDDKSIDETALSE